ncbi:MAG: bifunctional folylpolyglutamate synthase/dihydrofolate synthase [bacterium]|nr:bifunctional folylpolyglutamate synthase/dihydrofolate synthase [bacterium]
MDNYSDALKKLYSLQDVGIKLGLDNIKKLLSNINNPDKNLKFIHVAGTNGKGSVCAIVAKALENVGYKVGFYSSPHLVSLRERLRVNGKGISRDRLAGLINDIWPTVDKMYNEDNKVTFFEVTVAMAATYFADEKCDFVVWETGLGGRLDSTTAVDPIVTAISSIGLDHQAYLGDTLEKIAFEKAGIIKKGIPMFASKIPDGPLNVIKEVAEERNAPFYPFDKNGLTFTKNIGSSLTNWGFCLNKSIDLRDKENNFILPLPGFAQPMNMTLAYSILKYLSKAYSFDLYSALKGIEKLKWHGRIQLLPDGKILDGAHNPQGIGILVSSIKQSYPNTKFKIIFGCLEERNPKKVIMMLSEIADEFIFVPINSSRKCFEPNDMVKLLQSLQNFKIECKKADTLKNALSMINNEKTIITGSLYLAGETLMEYYSDDEVINI